MEKIKHFAVAKVKGQIFRYCTWSISILTALESQCTVLGIHWIQAQIHVTLSHNRYPNKTNNIDIVTSKLFPLGVATEHNIRENKKGVCWTWI